MRARSDEPVRSARGAHRRPRGRGLGACRRHDARRRQRDRRRCGDGRGRRRGDRARATRAPLHRLGGAGARRREGARRVARLRADADQPRRDERRCTDDRVRRERSHVPSRPAPSRARPAGSRRAPDRALRSEGRSLRRRHHRGSRERDQGARTRARGDSGAARCIRWRCQPERDPSRRLRHRRGLEERRDRVPRGR